MKYMKEFISHFQDRTVFSIRDAKTFLKQKGISQAYLHLLIHSLLKNGKLKRVNRGVYTFRNELEVAGFAFSPFYYGLHEALSLHNLWGQETNPVIITPRKVRQGVREVMQANIVVRRIDRKMFFGFEMIKHCSLWLPVSTPEKTLIDFVYFREKLPETALQEITSTLGEDILQQYLKKCPVWVKKRVKAAVDQTAKKGSTKKKKN